MYAFNKIIEKNNIYIFLTILKTNLVIHQNVSHENRLAVVSGYFF
jgi:hypothetical protein